ncbi:Glutathione transferase FosA [Streptomyces sp. MBT84]|jgi:catechol 2,3-dioxygenase-like lactoylglutathione lyase family enzyme|uniref:VOC family protein n=1 Tax=unclassified Streptomyces TaxID=2593676 RepID=UPI000740F6C6|nr:MULTISPECIES: VOC family protein [unclassified Streptomyces]KUJ39740.1 bleomycin resistance protein [Streptomyces sp. NRRL F-5122]MBW8701248.1 Glutathione transferase FosA [Streptomyces sp. MBT84]MDX3266054.1 VOC family protein [Streptomyces sp. MI02-2A]REE63011.1 catechol 2,3-dioxygenase-like lactoylglutathione lyase family enzyme [Streptomyces sp. 3212.3]
MAVELNHTIVAAHDKTASARFLADLLGLQVEPQYGPFMPVQMPNGVTLDFMDSDDSITPQHYAFLVSEDDFDAIFGRVRDAGLTYWADPHHNRPGEINHNDGGRGAYFDDPNGHNLEILTRPYGSGED